MSKLKEVNKQIAALEKANLAIADGKSVYAQERRVTNTAKSKLANAESKETAAIDKKYAKLHAPLDKAIDKSWAAEGKEIKKISKQLDTLYAKRDKLQTPTGDFASPGE